MIRQAITKIAPIPVRSWKPICIKRLLSSSSAGPAGVFDKVGVIGLGLMGHGIAQQTAASGKSTVIAYEAQEMFLDKGRSRIESSLTKLVSKSKLTNEQMSDILSNIHFTSDINDLKGADLIVEAIIENMDLKRDLYSQLGSLCKPECIFASNTSSLSIGDMAGLSGRPQLFCGVHFFNPVQIMKLVEVIHTHETDPAVIDKVARWVQDDLRKVPVRCGDTPGFIVNRLLVPSLMQAILMLERGDATIADIDVAMQLGAGHPMGPLHLADYVGLDTCLYIMQGWVEKYPNEPAFVIPKVLEEKVKAGDLGRKSGKGFYHWDGEKRGDVA
jgi:3-hydroxyacyl-CoA dehydrogenase